MEHVLSDAEIIDIVRQGPIGPIGLIKEIRARCGCSLASAKSAYDRLLVCGLLVRLSVAGRSDTAVIVEGREPAFPSALVAEMRRHIARMTELLAELDASVERRAVVR